jgi:hypothetical protein
LSNACPLASVRSACVRAAGQASNNAKGSLFIAM